jgi:hypothetical protein
MNTENILLCRVAAGYSESFWSSAEVRLVVQSPKLNEDDTTCTCRNCKAVKATTVDFWCYRILMR